MDKLELASIKEGFTAMKKASLILIKYFEVCRDNPDKILYHLKIKDLIEDNKYYEFVDSAFGLINELNIVCDDITNIL